MRFLIIALLILSAATVRAETWVYHFTDNWGNRIYYDADSITTVDKGITRLAVRTDYSKEGRSFFMESRRQRGLDVKPYKRLARSVSVWYIKCDEKKDDLHAVFEYDFENKIISTYKARKLEYAPIIPGTIGEIFYNIACGR